MCEDGVDARGGEETGEGRGWRGEGLGANGKGGSVEVNGARCGADGREGCGGSPRPGAVMVT